jgi:hypothetical protein
MDHSLDDAELAHPMKSVWRTSEALSICAQVCGESWPTRDTPTRHWTSAEGGRPSEARARETESQPISIASGWLAALDDFRNGLIREAA